MVDILYKLNRIDRIRRIAGLNAALHFELAWSLGQERLRLKLPGFQYPFEIRARTSDMDVFEQVFVERELDIQLECRPSTIIDGGANIGLTTAWLAASFPQAKVIAVEPSEENVKSLARNCRGLTNVEIVHGGIWHTNGYVRIVNTEAEPWSFKVIECERHETGGVRAWTISDLLEVHGLPGDALLKLDIEGAERELFSHNLDAWIDRICQIVMEVHGEGTQELIENTLYNHRFAVSRSGEKTVFHRVP